MLAATRPAITASDIVRRLMAAGPPRVVSSVVLHAGDLRAAAEALCRVLNSFGIEPLGPFATTDRHAQTIGREVEALIVVVDAVSKRAVDHALSPVRHAIGGQLLLPVGANMRVELAAKECVLRLRDASAIDLSTLSGLVFEQLVVELLAVMGMRSQPSDSADADYIGEAPMGLLGGRVAPGRYLVEVKHLSRPLGVGDIGSLVEGLDRNGPDVQLLIVTSTRLTKSARDLVRRTDLMRRVEVLEGPELRAILQQIPEFRERFIR